jgi:hypothetical protein
MYRSLKYNSGEFLYLYSKDQYVVPPVDVVVRLNGSKMTPSIPNILTSNIFVDAQHQFPPPFPQKNDKNSIRVK